MTEVQELVARLRLKDEMSGPLRKVRTGISGVSDALNHPRMQKGISQIGTGIKNAALIGAVGIGILVTQVAAGLKSLVELEQQEAQTNAVIKSTGGIAGITAEEVGKLAEKFESMNATIGDETIREAENMILTFTNIRKDAFEPTLEAVLDMNTALGKGPEGLTSTAILVGKALNDPIRGLTALTRVGVTFTDGQRDQIKAMVEAGDTMGAQQIILAELNKEFGGSFLAQGGTTAGKVAKFQDAIEDLQRALATALLPAVSKVADRLSTFLQDPAVIKGITDLGTAIGNLFSDENLDEAGRIFKSVFDAAKAAAPTIASAAQITGEVVKTAVSLFNSLPPEIQKLAIGAFAINKITGGLVTNVAGGLISSVLKQLVSGVVNVSGAVVNVVGATGVPGAGGAPKPAGGGIGGVAAAVVPLALVGAIQVGVAEAVGPSVRDALGVPAGGLGKVFDVGPLKFAIGQSAAAVAHADDANTTKLIGKFDPLRERLDQLKVAANLTKDDTVAATNRNATLLAAAAGRSTEAQRAAIAAASQKQIAAIAVAKAANQASAFAIRDRVATAGTQTKAAIDTARSGISTAARNAGRESAEAIRRKRLSVTNNVSVNTTVSVKDTIKSSSTFKSFGNVAL